MSHSKRLSSIATIVIPFVVTVGSLTPLAAFDTGHHQDLTRSALKTAGFNATSIRVAQLENWLVDYYSENPLAGVQPALKHLHFDNLAPSSRVQTYWAHFNTNSKSAFQKAAQEDDALRVVALLAMSLHAVQDFYTHSNWVEQHSLPSAGFLTDTYFSNPALAGAATLRTGEYPNHSPLQATDHGDGAPNSAGMNHDSYSRPRWTQAYVFAFCASREWVEAVKGWVSGINPQVWAQAMNLNLAADDSQDLDRDLEAAFRISEWAPGGHWKGPGSQNPAEFAAALAAWQAASDSVFVKHFKVNKWHEQITVNLGSSTPPAGPAPAIFAVSHPFRVVLVQTLHVEERPTATFESAIDVGGKADFFAKVRIDDQEFVEAMQLDKKEIDPWWLSVHFVPQSTATVSIGYQLWDEDGGTAGDDDHCDINPQSGKKDLQFSIDLGTGALSGDISGLHATPATAAELAGANPDNDRAKVRLVVRADQLN